MNSKLKAIIYIVIFAVFLGVSIISYNYLSALNRANNGNQLTASPTPDRKDDSDEEKEKDVEDKPLKVLDFKAYDYQGNEVRLYDYIGTPIVLNFWASWCPPCRAEMPHFNKVSEEYSQDELVFLMVDLVDGKRETVEKGKKFIEDNNYTFTVLFDTDQEAAYTYGIRSIPSTLFIDSEGYVQAGWEGGMEEDMLRRGIEMILE